MGLSLETRLAAVPLRSRLTASPFSSNGHACGSSAASWLALRLERECSRGTLLGEAVLLDLLLDEGARAALAVVHHEQAIGDAHLWRGEADADLVVHRLDHVADQPAELGRDLSDVRRFSPERGVAVELDVEQCHWV